MEQKGSMLLKVVSIIMIVGGIIGAVVSVIMAASAGVVTAVMGSAEVQDAAAQAGTSTGVVTGLLWAAVAVLVIGAVVEIIAGVKGKKNWNNPAAGQTLMVWGIITAVISLVGNILFISSGSAVNVISILSGLVLPVLYIIGSVQLKNQA